MTAAFVDATFTFEASADPITIPLGTVADGNLVIALWGTFANRTVTSTTPTFTAIGNSVNTRRLEAQGRIKQSGDSSSLSVNLSGVSNNGYYCALKISGAKDPVTQAPDWAGAAVGTGVSTITSSAVTVTDNDSLFFLVYWTDGTDTPSAPTGFTEVGQGEKFTVWQKDAAVNSGTSGTWGLSSLNTAYRHWLAGIAVPPSAASAPTISSVTLSGTSQIGNTLTATVVTDQDPVDSTAYQWEKASDGSGTGAADISGETSSTLALTYADFGDLLDTAAYVRCGAIATKNALPSDEAFSAWQQVTVPSSAGLVSSPLKSPFLIA